MFGAFLAGLGRCLGSPGIVAGLWAVNVLFALPAAWVIGASIHDSVGSSLTHRELVEGFDHGWHGEFLADARGIETTVQPDIFGIGAFLDNLEGWATAALFDQPAGLLGIVAVYAIVWTVMLGGVVDRYIHAGGPQSIATFLSAGGRYLFRFLRLAILSAALYASVYFAGRRTYARLEVWTRDVTSEWTVLVWSLSVILVTVLALVVIHLGFAYAKIATVAEDRRSMVLAALRGLAFTLSHPVRTLGLWAIVALLSAASLYVYARIAPGAGTSTWAGVVWGLALAQLFLAARLMLRLSLLGGQAALYRALRDE